MNQNPKNKHNSKSTHNKRLVLILILLVIVIAMVPLFTLKGASFGGSDDAGSQMIQSISKNYHPWFTPILEQFIGGELPGEIESLLFCVQTGIGVGIIAFFMGRFVERKKWMDKEKQNKMVCKKKTEEKDID